MAPSVGRGLRVVAAGQARKDTNGTEGHELATLQDRRRILPEVRVNSRRVVSILKEVTQVLCVMNDWGLVVHGIVGAVEATMSVWCVQLPPELSGAPIPTNKTTLLGPTCEHQAQPLRC